MATLDFTSKLFQSKGYSQYHNEYVKEVGTYDFVVKRADEGWVGFVKEEGKIIEEYSANTAGAVLSELAYFETILYRGRLEESQDLVPTVIDLEELKRNHLDESFLVQFGAAVKLILQRMLGGSSIPVKVRGNSKDVASFANVIGKEKKYMESFMQSGLDNPKTYRSKGKLDAAVSKFERRTGLKWPFK